MKNCVGRVVESSLHDVVSISDSIIDHYCLIDLVGADILLESCYGLLDDVLYTQRIGLWNSVPKLDLDSSASNS